MEASRNCHSHSKYSFSSSHFARSAINPVYLHKICSPMLRIMALIWTKRTKLFVSIVKMFCACVSVWGGCKHYALILPILDILFICSLNTNYYDFKLLAYCHQTHTLHSKSLLYRCRNSNSIFLLFTNVANKNCFFFFCEFIILIIMSSIRVSFSINWMEGKCESSFVWLDCESENGCFSEAKRRSVQFKDSFQF